MQIHNSTANSPSNTIETDYSKAISVLQWYSYNGPSTYGPTLTLASSHPLCSTDTDRKMLYRWHQFSATFAINHMMYSCNYNTCAHFKEHVYQFMYHWNNPDMDEVPTNS